jgi:hypothetical protein
VSLMEPAECERAEVDVPDAIVDFLQAHILPGADGGDSDPVRVPADAAIGTGIPGTPY